MTDQDSVSAAVTAARRVLDIEARAVSALAEAVGESFERAVAHVLVSPGRVIVSGMGKSGIVGHKIAATLMSTGTPSDYMHAGEAYHGDIGMVTPHDTFLAISNSGETDEVIRLLPYLADNGNFVIAMTGKAHSTLALEADCHFDVSVEQEACPLHLAPTASTTATLAMGDAFAVALMEARGFTSADFARFHPGGSLGRRLLDRVENEMITDGLPILEPTAGFVAVIQAITSSNLGLALVDVGGDWAVITDGDLRRAVERFGTQVFERSAKELMSTRPHSVNVGTLMTDTIAKMERHNVSSLLVFDAGMLVGIVKK